MAGIFLALSIVSVLFWGLLLLLFSFAAANKYSALKTICSTLIQILVFCSFVSFLTAWDDWLVVLTTMIGPFAPLQVLDAILLAHDVGLWRAFWPLALTGFVLTCVAMSKAARPAQRLTVFLSLVVATPLGYITANAESTRMIEREAQRRGATCLAAGSLYTSMLRHYDNWPVQVHASAIIDGQFMAWSYFNGTFFKDPRIAALPEDPETSCHFSGLKPRDI